MATILTKRSNTASSVPVAGDLTNSTGGAELAVNTADKRLFTKDSGGTVVELGTNPSSITLASGTANAVPYLNGSKVLTSGSALTFDGTNLGVGTASPAVKLHASSAGTTYIRVATTGTTGQEIAYQWIATNSDASSNQWKLGTNFAADNEFTIYDLTNSQVVDRYIRGASGYRAFSVNGSEQMRLTSTGLGIGTSSPSTKLQVTTGATGVQALFSHSNGTPTIAIGNSTTTYNTQIGYNVNSEYGYIQAVAAAGVYDDIAINPNGGNLGIGTSSPAWKLDVDGIIASRSGSLSGLRFQTSANGNNGYVLYETSSNSLIVNNYNAGPITFKTSDAERMRIDSSGNLGIGTSSPVSKVHAYGSGQIVTIESSTDLAAGGASGYLRFKGSNGNSAYIGFGGTANSYTISNGLASGFITFETGGGTERARIDSSGNLLVGTTSSEGPSKLSVVQSTTNQACVGMRHTLGAGEAFARFINAANNAVIGSISNNGNTATAYNTSSDYRLKNTIAPMTGALAKVAALKPCTYKWNADGSDGEGFIAHELAEVVPQCVTGEKDAVDADGNPVYQGIDTSFLVATLTAAIQELKAEVDALKSEINTLKGI